MQRLRPRCSRLPKTDTALLTAAMFLKTRADGSLLEVLDLRLLFDPFATSVPGRLHAGEELQDSSSYLKSELCFPSDEPLPRCWLDPAYQQP